MLSDMLLQTKMIPPPQRPFLIPRPQLSQKLAKATAVPLTLVSAPAGFGKTTLVTNWINEKNKIHPAKIRWLSLDSQDNEPSRFWQYFFAASSPSSTLAEQLTQPQPPPVQALLTGLINHLTQQAKHMLFILDDIHLIENRDILQNLTFLLENAPPTLHLVFITRADPPLPLHRFRARGQLLEIRADDLRFNKTESADFLQKATQQTLSDENMALLAEQTEGWPVGLQLAALALPQQTTDQDQFIQRLASSNRYILEYLAEEVLAQQPEPVQTFLLQTAVLDELCAELCDAILAIPQPPLPDPHSQEILDYLDRHNLFIIPLDNAQQWYRYHHLFAALLRGHLQQQMPEMVPILHQRASHWFAAQGQVETAVTHAFAAQDNTLAATLIEKNASHMVMQGRAKLVETWLQQLATEQTQTMPRTNLAFAQALLLRGQFAETAHYLSLAEQGNRANPNKMLQGQILAFQAILADTRGDHVTAQSRAQQAIQLAAPDDITSQAMAHFALASAAREAGNVNTACQFYEKAIPLCRTAHLLLLELLARAHLCLLYQIRGLLQRAQAITAPIAETNNQHPAAVAVYAAQANVYLEQYQLAEAEKWLQKALAMEQAGGHNAAMIQAQIINGRLQLAKNKREAAQKAFAKAEALFQQGAPAWQNTLLRSAQVSFWLAQNDPSTATRCLVQATPPPRHLQPLLDLAKARIERHHNTPTSLENAQNILEAVMETATPQQLHGIIIEAELLLALVKSAQNQQHPALTHLQKALQLAEPENHALPFIELGSPLQELLAKTQNPYAKDLLSKFQDPNSSFISHPSSLLNSLTERETEVLHLMTSGLTYQQIADEMVVSVNTVRHHVKGLYSKLGVNSRAQAVAKAQALGINDF